MTLYRESIPDNAVIMMRRVLNGECVSRQISADSVEGEDLALLIMHAFRDGMTEESELVVLARNCVEDGNDAEKIKRRTADIKSGQPLL